MTDRLVSTHNTHNRQASMPPHSGIPTHNLSRRAAADLRLRLRGGWDRFSGPFLPKIFINDLCKVIKHSQYWLFADDVTIFCAINSADHCILLQSDIESTHRCSTPNCVKLNSSKTGVIAFTDKTIVLYYTYELWDPSATRTDTIKDRVVQLNSKLHFYAHVDYIFPQSVRILGLTAL